MHTIFSSVSTGHLPPVERVRALVAGANKRFKSNDEIITVAPEKKGLGTFAPRLDQVGNSVKGRLAAKFLSKRLGLNLFTSESAEN